jgi:hypothetical protein
VIIGVDAFWLQTGVIFLVELASGENFFQKWHINQDWQNIARIPCFGNQHNFIGLMGYTGSRI